MSPYDLQKPIKQISDFGIHKKVMRRIAFGVQERYIGSGEETTLLDVLKMSEKELRKIPYFGLKYTELFQRVKEELYPSEVVSEGALNCSSLDNDVKWDDLLRLAERVELNRINFLASHHKALEKIEAINLDSSVRGLLLQTERDLYAVDGIGDSVVKNVMDMRRACVEELSKALNHQVNISEFESLILLPTDVNDLTITRADSILVEDLDAFIAKLSMNEATVFNQRWGFTEAKKTLSEIGQFLEVTRERVRQIETKINDRFYASCRLRGDILEAVIENNLDYNIASKFSVLYECFNSEADLLSFLEFCADGLGIKNRLRPDVSHKIVDEIFVESGVPLNKKELLDNLELRLDSDFNFELVIDYLMTQGKLRIECGEVFPEKLGKHDSVACILANNPGGLPWKDAAIIVNRLKVSKTHLDESRRVGDAFCDSDKMFLAGKGVYKHTKFLAIQPKKFHFIINEVLDKLSEFARGAAHLNEVRSKSPYLQEFDYYSLRYIVKMYGVDEGIYFKGKSQADTISIDKEFGLVNQKDVILYALRNNRSSLTKNEIAQLIKSRSANHASVYLDELVNEKKVVQVERMLYTTPEQAFEGIDCANLGEFLEGEIGRHIKPVHPSVLKDSANYAFGFSFSFRFYDAFLKFWSEDLKLNRSGQFYSNRKISFTNLTNFLDQNVDPNVSVREAMNVVHAELNIDEAFAQRAFWNWRTVRLG